MPTFKGQVTEDQLVSLIAYIKSIAGQTGAPNKLNTTPATAPLPDASRNFDTDGRPVEPTGGRSNP